MRILIDTNILFSAALYPHSAPHRAFEQAVTLPNVGIVSYQSLEELTTVFQKKIPRKMALLENFLVTYLCGVELIAVPNESIDSESKIRDLDDRTMYRSAVKANVDIILTFSLENNELIHNSCQANVKDMEIIADKQHINSYEFIRDVVNKHTGLKDEVIMVYE